jgi:nucleotide-binding universal stress UspA family protein
MYYKTVFLGLGFEQVSADDVTENQSSETYAMEFAAREQAHLIVFLAAPLFGVPSAGLVPLAHELVDEVNADRLAHAEDARRRLMNAASVAGVTVEFHIVQESYSSLQERLISQGRASDIVILARATHYLALTKDMIDTMLFKSGRPVIAVPSVWAQGARFEKIMVGWDGGARAARAVGDALPLLRQAEAVEILCVTPDTSKKVLGADIASHLSRHCKKVALANLPTQHGDIAKTLRAYVAAQKADLLVMGAYAHPRLLEVVLGGVTHNLLADAEFPLFMSY